MSAVRAHRLPIAGALECVVYQLCRGYTNFEPALYLSDIALNTLGRYRKAGIVGGTQNGVIAGLVWTPIQYLRFNMNYAHLSYMGAAILAGGRSDYDANVMGVRAELDF